MNCPTCGYDVDLASGVTCPRCDTVLTCSAVDCGDCGGCSIGFGGLRRIVRSSLLDASSPDPEPEGSGDDG